jgi:hypothetical protein
MRAEGGRADWRARRRGNLMAGIQHESRESRKARTDYALLHTRFAVFIDSLGQWR